MSKGEHENAAQIFLSLAERAQDRGILQPASMLFLQAAHAYLLGGKVEDSIEQATNGLKMIAADVRWKALEREGERFVAVLESNGYQKQADEMRAWLDERLSGHLVDTQKEKAKKAVQLPEKCPYCGASMSLEQISGRGSKAAECRYCGSVVVPTQIE